jgi:hypothetical protein
MKPSHAVAWAAFCVWAAAAFVVLPSLYAASVISGQTFIGAFCGALGLAVSVVVAVNVAMDVAEVTAAEAAAQHPLVA